MVMKEMHGRKYPPQNPKQKPLTVKQSKGKRGRKKGKK